MYSEVPEILQEFMIAQNMIIYVHVKINTSVKKRGKIQPSVNSNVCYIKKMCQNHSFK